VLAKKKKKNTINNGTKEENLILTYLSKQIELCMRRKGDQRVVYIYIGRKVSLKVNKRNRLMVNNITTHLHIFKKYQ
jgi:hypothetical protein